MKVTLYIVLFAVVVVCLSSRAARADTSQPPLQTVQQVEAAHIQTVLAQQGGNVDKAAKALNLSRATLYRRLKQLNEQTL